MATTVIGAVNSNVSASIQNTQALSTTFSGNPSVNFSCQFSNAEITKCFFQSYSATTGGTSIDLKALTDAFGSALSFSNIKHLQVWNQDTVNGLIVGGATSGVVPVLPTLTGRAASVGSNGSCLSLTTSVSVDPGTRFLKLASTAGTVSAWLMILGN